MEKKLSKKALSKSFHNWYYGHLTCFSQEHMQTFGYLCACFRWWKNYTTMKMTRQKP